MKLNDKFILHTANGQTMLVPVGGSGFSGMIRGNVTLLRVLELLKTETTEEEVIGAMRERFDAPPGQIESDVKKVLDQLREIGAIDG